MSESNCTTSIIANFAQFDYHSACAFARDACSDEYEFVDFIGFFYCDIDQNYPLIIFISILFVGFAFNFFGTTADIYLAPTLEIMSSKLKLTAAVAGCTLLSFANGAPDVVSGIAAGGKSSGGVDIAIGGLFGACLFVVTIVLARCIQGAGEVKASSEDVLRDVIFLIMGTVYFMFLCVINEVTPLLASGFFFLYAVYIIYLFISERRKAIKKESLKGKLLKFKAKYLQKTLEKQEHHDAWDDVVGPYIVRRLLKHKLSRGKKVKLEDFAKFKDADEEAQETEDEEEEDDNSFLGKIMKVYNAPLIFIRDLTMPPFDTESWNIYRASVTPIFGSVFLAWQFGLIDAYGSHWELWVILGIIAVCLSATIYISGRTHNLSEEYSGTFATATFIGATMWINFIAIMFMDFLSLVAVLSGLPINFLSMTMLAWGNSLGDFFVNYVISKNGHGMLAVTGTFSGQIFNLLLGFGGAMFRQSLMNGKVILDIFDFSGQSVDSKKTDILTIGLVSINLFVMVTTLVIAKSNAWVLSKVLLIFAIVTYVSFFFGASLLSFIPLS